MNKFIFLLLASFFLWDYASDPTKSEASYIKTITHEQLIKAKAEEYNFEPALINALIHVESGHNARAISQANARGLMQIVPKWHMERCYIKDERELFIAHINLDCGLSYLRELVDKHTLVNALKVYNGGNRCATRNCGKENREYPNKILKKLTRVR